MAPLPDPSLDSAAILALGLAILAGLGLLVALARFAIQVSRGRRTPVRRPRITRLLLTMPWLAWLLFALYAVYLPLPLYLPAWYPDMWASPSMACLVSVLAAWTVYGVVAAFFPRQQGASRKAVNGTRLSGRPVTP